MQAGRNIPSASLTRTSCPYLRSAKLNHRWSLSTRRTLSARAGSGSSCMMTAKAATQYNITTLEGLAENGNLHPVQEAFVKEQAAQCGYCLNGMIISAVALLETNPKPTENEIREALNPVICRCGTHSRFIQAVKLASG